MDKAEKAQLAEMKPPRSSVVKEQHDNQMKRKRTDSQESTSPELELGASTRWSDRTRWVSGETRANQPPPQNRSNPDSGKEAANGEARDPGLLYANHVASIVPIAPGMRVRTSSYIP